MSITYIGQLKTRFRASHMLSLASAVPVSTLYIPGGSEPNVPSLLNTKVQVDFAELKSRANFGKLLASSFIGDQSIINFTTGGASGPTGRLRGWHWLFEIEGLSFNFDGAGVSTIVGESLGLAPSAAGAIASAVEARASALAKASLLNHDSSIHTANYNLPTFTATLTAEELTRALVTPDGKAPMVLSDKIEITKSLANEMARDALETCFANGYNPFETKPKADDAPAMWYSASSSPYAGASYELTFDYPPRQESKIEFALYYDSAVMRYFVSNQLLDDEGRELAQLIADEGKTLQIAAGKKAMGEEATVPKVSAVVPTDYQNPLVKQQATDWQIAYQVEAEKVNKMGVQDIVTPYLTSVGKTPEEIAAEKLKISTGAAPGAANWTSIWDTLKGAGSTVGDYMAKWSPSDYVGAYAGYKATNAITSNPWLLFAVVAVVAVVVLK